MIAIVYCIASDSCTFDGGAATNSLDAINERTIVDNLTAVYRGKRRLL